MLCAKKRAHVAPSLCPISNYIDTHKVISYLPVVKPPQGSGRKDMIQ